MEIVFKGERAIEVNNCRIMWRNFSGLNSKYADPINKRGFIIPLPNKEIADELEANGWTVKPGKVYNDGEDPMLYLEIKFNYKIKGKEPVIRLKTGNRVVRLSENTVDCLDEIDIESVSLDAHGSDWVLSDGREGRTAWLDSLLVVQKLDRFAYLEEEAVPFED